MAPSIDGRIVTTRWKPHAKLHQAYESTAASFGADAWMIGRVSAEPYAGRARVPRRPAGAPAIPRRDFVADHGASSFAITLDPSGKLRWTASAIDDEHVITILTEAVSDDYLAFLRATGVSYLFGGKTAVSLPRVLAKLRAHFGIRTVVLEGGGKINGAFLADDLVDELSVLVAPVVDGALDTATLFDLPRGRTKSPARPLRLGSVEKLAGDLVWLRYTVRR